ncbi:MAG TPA: bifunctional transaldolase/phosoglucose isomerase [Xanthobacteraceae bacterium]|nr:bifunctional transaldolase/phosoglucose isomerase [Xanthobacteraceae bacterium]
MNPLKHLEALGQSVWIDFVARDFLRQGGLQRLVAHDGVSGVTSNPAIFEKAMVESDAYDALIETAIASGDASVTAIYEELAIADIREAADQLRRAYDVADRHDGHVSLEVSPYLAHDTEVTIAEARRLWRTVGRENLMIKVPATAAGLPAIRQLIADGINVNITLLFSQDVYEQVADAYVSGLEAVAARGDPIAGIAGVASFFVSRIDTAVEKEIAKRLKTLGNDDADALRRLRGTVAIANAKLAYQRYLRLFAGPRWQRLAALGARPQRLLWASTGTKSPDLSDVLYVEQLIGADTVNTMPPKTLEAFRDHGRARVTLTERIDEAHETLATLERFDISLSRITDDLVADGVRLFAEAFDELLGGLARKRAQMLGTALDGAAMELAGEQENAVEQAQEEWRAAGNGRRLWHRDAGLWTGHDESSWLDWLDIVDRETGDLERIEVLAADVRRGGFTDVLLLGMGGSSLGPEVIGRTFGTAAGFPRLHVLDSTDPQQVGSFEGKVDLGRTLFIVSSKSGTTLEPNVFMEYFYARAGEAAGPDRVGERFIAITDPGSRLQRHAAERRFRDVFLGVPGIGGRYSVLSNFGMVPAAVTGLDVRRFLDATRPMVRACGPDVPPAQNPGIRLGLAMGVLGVSGRDKVTVIASPAIDGFGAWAEQLIAESTGKNERGLIPVDGERLGPPEVYGADRLFIYLRLAGGADPTQGRAVDALARAGHPVVRIGIADAKLLGQEFFRFELATAVAGAIFGINPFDQPDVEASKTATRELTDVFEREGSLPSEQPVFRRNGIALFADAHNAQDLMSRGADSTLEGWLGAHFGRVAPGDYAATLAYVEQNEPHTRTLQELRMLVRDRKRVATCLGFGPRFLHSTGQAYKGGPNTGVFLQITTQDAHDLIIPGRNLSFGVIKAAQARGDFRVLAERGRRVLRAHVTGDLEAGLAELGNATRRALEHAA